MFTSFSPLALGDVNSPSESNERPTIFVEGLPPWYVKMEIPAPLQIEGMVLGWLTLPIEITMEWMIVCSEFCWRIRVCQSYGN